MELCSFYAMNTTIEVCVHFELTSTSIRPNLVLIHLYVPTLQMIIEHDEAMMYIVEVMAPIITYVEVIFL